jgi:hypothetical protein
MSVVRFVFEYLVKAALFIGLDFFLGRSISPAVGNLCALVGFGVSEACCLLVRHAGIECVVDFLAEKWREIIEFFLVIAVLMAPLWAGGLLLWYQHPFLAWPLMIVGEPAMLAWVFDDNRQEIIEVSFAVLVLGAPLWVGSLLLLYQHPLLAWPLMLVGEPAMLVWAANLPDPKKVSKPPSAGGPAGPPPDAGTPGAVAPG